MYHNLQLLNDIEIKFHGHLFAFGLMKEPIIIAVAVSKNVIIPELYGPIVFAKFFVAGIFSRIKNIIGTKAPTKIAPAAPQLFAFFQ